MKRIFLEHFQKNCSHAVTQERAAIFLGFGFVFAQSQALLGMLLRSNLAYSKPKKCEPHGPPGRRSRIGYSFSNALALTMCLALMLVTGCNTVSISSNQYLANTLYAPTNPDTIAILHAPPTRPHVRLGEVTAQPSGDNVSAEKIVTALQKAAAKMGGDAVVIVYDRTQITGAYVTGGWYGRSIQYTSGRVIRGVVIKYTGN